MFCVVQEIKTKKVSVGEAKKIEVYESSWIMNGEQRTYFKYRYSEERFERPNKKAYKISIHQSYRENGKIRKKQISICTVRYYDIVDWGDWIGDYVRGGLKSKAEILGISEKELTDLIYKKFQPIADQIKAEFEGTEEYRAREQHRQIINEHNERKESFKKKYELDSSNEYDRCYDVFGQLRNSEYLEKIKREYKQRKEYEKRSQEQSRSYYEKFYSNYGGYSGGSYYGGSVSNYNDTDKAMLKKFYRTLSKAFHPDSNPDKDTSEEMKMLNRLKSDWGV